MTARNRTLIILPLVILSSIIIRSVNRESIQKPDTRNWGKPVSQPVEVYLDSALSLMRTRMYEAPKQDWTLIRARLFREAGGAATPKDAYAALNRTLRRIDPHSSLRPADLYSQIDEAGKGQEYQPSGKLLAGKVGYIRLPSFGSPTRTYGARGQAILSELQARACGWIIDLRGNGGGTLWGMLIAVGPLLEDTAAAAFVDRDGRQARWGYASGGVAMDTARLIIDSPVHMKAYHPPVAILQGGNTGSASEAIVVAFTDRPHVKTFGTTTAGYASGNKTYQMSDGARLVLTETFIANRKGRLFGDLPIRPDVWIGDDKSNSKAGTADNTVRAAVRWLESQDACTPAAPNPAES